MLPLAQRIIGRTEPKSAPAGQPQDPYVDILVIERASDAYGVLMSGTAFPIGTEYPTAEEAVVAAVKALNAVLAPKSLTILKSPNGEEFVLNSRLAQLV